MKALLYNRILIFLGYVGLFVAGVLSVAHYLGIVPPCGAGSECDRVTNDPSSLWFGGHVYVGYIGLVGYILLTCLALLRAFGPPRLFRPFTLLGYLIAAGGTLISIGLQFYSYFVIHAMCKWCLTSAVTMTLSLVVYALLYQEITDEPESVAPSGGKGAGLNYLLTSGLTCVLALGLVGMVYVLKHSGVPGTKVVAPASYPLVPENPNLYGDGNAPVTVVEFADLNCPACQLNSPKLKDFVHAHEGRIRLIYRHFPIPTHHTSELAAAIDEYAAEKGKFWDYTMAVMGTHREIEDPNELFTIAQSVNLDVDDLKKHLANTGDPIYKRLSDDQNCANLIGVMSTPTFVLMSPKSQAEAYGPSQLWDALDEQPYASILAGKS